MGQFGGRHVISEDSPQGRRPIRRLATLALVALIGSGIVGWHLLRERGSNPDFPLSARRELPRHSSIYRGHDFPRHSIAVGNVREVPVDPIARCVPSPSCQLPSKEREENARTITLRKLDQICVDIAVPNATPSEILGILFEGTGVMFYLDAPGARTGDEKTMEFSGHGRALEVLKEFTKSCMLSWTVTKSGWVWIALEDDAIDDLIPQAEGGVAAQDVENAREAGSKKVEGVGGGGEDWKSGE
jgi:hypothetical protein